MAQHLKEKELAALKEERREIHRRVWEGRRDGTMSKEEAARLTLSVSKKAQRGRLERKLAEGRAAAGGEDEGMEGMDEETETFEDGDDQEIDVGEETYNLAPEPVLKE